MTYLDHGTGKIITDEDLAIAMTGEGAVTAEVSLAAVALVIDGSLEPIWTPEAA